MKRSIDTPVHKVPMLILCFPHLHRISVPQFSHVLLRNWLLRIRAINPADISVISLHLKIVAPVF